MEFLAPLMLVGVIAVGVPIAIHLFGRQRAKEIRFAAVDFLLGSDERVARRLKIRDFILLSLRALACLAVALALAKPTTSCEAGGPEVGNGPQAAVIIVDNSLASGYRMDGESLLERAAARTRRIVEQLGPDSEVALILAAEGASPPGELSADHLKLIADVGALTPVPRGADTTTALRRAAELLATSPRPTRRVFLMTTLVKSSFRTDEAPWTSANAPELTVIDLADGNALPNLAVTKVSVVRDPDSGSRGVRVTAEVANYSDEAVSNLPALLRVDSRVVTRGSVSIAANSRVEKTFTGSLPEGARSAPIEVEISGDPLTGDNSRFSIGELRDQVRTLLVNGDPRSTRHLDELFYLEAALRPGDRDESGILVARITAAQLADVELEQFDVVVLANCLALPPKLTARLADWVSRGGGLWIGLGSNVDANDYNEKMAPLLPGSLRSLYDTTFGRSGAEKSGSAVALSKLETDHPLFSSFDVSGRGLAEARFAKLFLLSTTTAVEKRRVLARYDSGATAIIEAPMGEGRLLLYTSTLDRDWNDLPIQPGFLPLVQQAVRYLGRKPTELRRRDSLVGTQRILDVTAEADRIEVVRPNGRATAISKEHISADGRALFEDTMTPGFYSVATVRANSSDIERAYSEDFTINVDTAASDLARLDQDNLPAGAGGTSAAVSSQKHKRRVELWHALAALLLGFLLVESILSVRG